MVLWKPTPLIMLQVLFLTDDMRCSSFNCALLRIRSFLDILKVNNAAAHVEAFYTIKDVIINTYTEN